MKTDCELPVDARPISCCGAPDARRLRALYERFEFKSWLQRHRRDAPRPTSRGAIAARRARDTAGRRFDNAPSRTRRCAAAAGARVALRDGDRRGGARALARGDRRARSSCAFDTETTSLDPMQARDRRPVASRSSPGARATSRSRIAMPARPTQLRSRRVLARLAPWLADSDANEGRPEPQVRPARARQPRPRARRRRARHAARVVRARIAQAARHGQPRVAPPRREDDHLRRGRPARARTRSPSTRSRVERATEYSAEDADVTLQLHRALYPRDRGRRRSSTHVYATIEMPVRDVLFRMERNGVLIDAALLAAQSRELGERVMALEQQAHELAGQPFNLGSPKQLGEILFERMKLPVVQEDRDRPAVDRRGRAAGARRRLSAAEAAARASRAVEAQVDVHRQAAADGQSAHRAACTRRSRRRRR